jgi:hypothetical protein
MKVSLMTIGGIVGGVAGLVLATLVTCLVLILAGAIVGFFNGTSLTFTFPGGGDRVVVPGLFCGMCSGIIVGTLLGILAASWTYKRIYSD